MTLGVVSGLITHAAGYDRQSEGRENASVASPVSQRAANHAKAMELKEQLAREGGELRWVKHFSEAPGTSAFGTAERPEFNALLNECRAGRVNMIIVMYVSRFSRQTPMESIPIVMELLALGVTIVSVTEGVFRRDNLMDLISLIMRLDQAHNESKNKSVAVLAAKTVARELGGYTGGKAPYGFKMVPEQRVINSKGQTVTIQRLEHVPEEVMTIQWLCAEIKLHKDTPYDPNEGIHPGSITGLCKRLTQMGVPTRGATIGKQTKNSTWDAQTLKRILRDPRIAGYGAEVVYPPGATDTRTRRAIGYRIQRDPITMKPVQAYTPIIDPADWHELQAWVDSRGRGKGKSRGQSLLSAMDVLYCECGSVMASHKGPESIRDGYRCNRKVAMPGKHAGSCIVAALSLDKHVADRIFARLRHAADDEDTMIMLLEATRRFGKLTEAPEKAGERASLVAERADALRALEELYEDRAEGGYSGPVGRKHFLKAEAAANFRLQGAEERLVELETAANPTLPIDAWMPQDPGADPTGPDSWWGKADLADRRAFVKLFVDRIVIKKAAKYAGTGVPIASRVTMTFATIQDDSPEDQDDTA